MCIYNDLYGQSIIRSEDLIFNVASPVLVQESISQQYLYLREPLVKLLLSVQKDIEPQFQTIENDKVLSSFYLYHKERLEKLREIERKYKDPTEDKKGEILQEEKKLLREVIVRSRLRANKIFEKIEQTEFMEIYFKSIYGSLKNWQKLQKKDEIRAIFDPYAEDFQKIEWYEKKLEECKYYQGFHFHSIGKWKFSIVDRNNHKIYYRESPILCLRLEEENSYYPYKYMVVCIDLKMESGALSENEDDAYENLKTSFDFYFQNMLKTKSDLKKIDKIAEKKNIWKETFNELSDIGMKRKIRKKNYTYKWMLNTGVSNA